jgi:signal transduction histidine kinase/ActR/RegA family two-component response regulator
LNGRAEPIKNRRVRWPHGKGEMARRVREHAWEATPLGPTETWPQSLKTIVDALLSSGFPMLAIWGRDLVQIYNDPYREIIEAMRPAALGQPIRQTWPEYWAEVAPIFERVWAGETVRRVDARYPVARGGRAPEDAWFELGYSPLRDETGAVAGTLVTALETTARVRAAAALGESEARLRAMVEDRKELHDQREGLLAAATAARADAEQAMRAKDQFLLALSHELRTPLAPILLWARALRDGAVPAREVPHAIDAIIVSAESQLQLIEDLRDLSRLESGRIQLEKGAHAVEEVARAAMDVIRPTARAKGVALELEVTADLGQAVFDRGRVQQVFWNLLSNAVKFTSDGGRVSLRVQKQDGQLEAVVADTGQGIEADFLPHLFQRFRQGQTHERLRYAGLGVGLAVCRYLVELHGGGIEGQSDGPGHGATFTVRMPWVPATGAARAESSEGSPSDAPASPLLGLRVLLVEDDENTRDIMRWMLEGAGAAVVSAGSGTEALSVFEAGDGAAARPDVMVCDLGLPGMSGFDLIERIAAHLRARGARAIPACAISAFARDEDRARAIDAGFDSYLAKPMTAQRLIAAVEELAAVAATDLVTGGGGTASP